MAKEDENALALLNMDTTNRLKMVQSENTALKQSMNPLGMAGMGAVTIATGAVIGGVEGYRTMGDKAKEEALQNVTPGLALAAGIVGVVAAGNKNPKLRAAAAGVAVGGGTIIAYNASKAEGIKMALEAAKVAPAAPPPAQVGGVKPAWQAR